MDASLASTLALAVEGLTVGYGAAPVLEGLSLRLESGELAALIGPNGSGKSTLLKAVTGRLRARAGRVLLFGRPLEAWPAADRARRVAVVSQEEPAPFAFRVDEVVAMGRSPHLKRFQREGARDRAAVLAAMEQTGVAGLAGRIFTTLSGGERQRVILARALAQEPRLLLLDEPTSHLDIGHQAEVLGLLRELCRTRGLAILTVLHDLNLASLYAPRLILLAGGRIVADGPPSSVLGAPLLEEVYGTRVILGRHPACEVPSVHLWPGEGRLPAHGRAAAGERSL